MINNRTHYYIVYSKEGISGMHHLWNQLDHIRLPTASVVLSLLDIWLTNG